LRVLEWCQASARVTLQGAVILQLEKHGVRPSAELTDSIVAIIASGRSMRGNEQSVGSVVDLFAIEPHQLNSVWVGVDAFGRHRENPAIVWRKAVFDVAA